MKQFETETYIGSIEDVVDAEVEDFAFGLLNELAGHELIDRDEFHEVHFLYGGWADARDYFLGIFKACGLEW